MTGHGCKRTNERLMPTLIYEGDSIPMSSIDRFLPAVALATLVALLPTRSADAFPSRTEHPDDAASIHWEKDGTQDGSSAHNHNHNRSFGSWNSWSREPYTSSGCWDNRTFRYDRMGTFDEGHCFIDEAGGSDNLPKFFFSGSGWPAEAQDRIRDAFAAWGAIDSDDDQLLTGIAFEEAASAAAADIEIFWENQNGAHGGGFWAWNTQELHFDNSLSWYFQADPMEGQPGGIQNGEWHFLSVALHEVGHSIGLEHQEDLDLMDPTVGQPPEVAGHRYFVAPDIDSITGVRDLYSQPHRRVAFVIDDTGSMSEEIGLVKTTVREKVDEFVAEDLLLRYHLLTYKDAVDYRGSTTDSETIKSWVDALAANGGDDCPEEMLGALDRIAVESPHSDAWVMTDAGFHGDLGDLATTIFHLLSARVRVHPIVYSTCFASGAPADGQRVDLGPGPGLDGRPETGAGIGPESFVQLAEESGGHYFPITTAETPAAASILLNEMVTTADFSRRRDTAVVGVPEIHTIAVESGTEEVNFLLNGFSGSLSLAIEDPTGLPVGSGDPGVTYTSTGGVEYYQIADPLPGLWRLEVTGSGDFSLSVSGDSPIVFEYLGDTSLPLGEEVSLSASLSGAVEDLVFRLVRPDGAPVDTITLLDDGRSGDGSAGDGIYAGTYTPEIPGRLLLRVEGIEALDRTGFEREAPEVIRVQPLAVEGDGNERVNRGDEVVRRFRIENLGDADSFRLSVSSTQEWADLGGVPGSITLGTGEVLELEIPVTVPADAEPASVEEIVLVVLSESDPFISDAASAFTTMRTLLNAAIP